MPKTKKVEVVWNPNRFKVGDRIKLAPWYWEKSRVIHTVVKIQKHKVNMKWGTSGLWLKTDKRQGLDWIDAHWFVKAK